jgi:hypothetical protein
MIGIGMKAQLFNFWNKIKDWLLLLPVLFFIDFLMDVFPLYPRGTEHYPIFRRISVLCLGDVDLMKLFVSFLFLCSFVSFFTSRTFFVKAASLICAFHWFFWTFFSFFSPKD